MSEQTDWVLKRYEQLESRYNDWENEAENINRVNGRDLSFLEEVNDCWDAATDYFVRLQERHHLSYLDLMASHISHAVNYWCEAWQRLKEGNARDNYGLRALVAEGSRGGKGSKGLKSLCMRLGSRSCFVLSVGGDVIRYIQGKTQVIKVRHSLRDTGTVNCLYISGRRIRHLSGGTHRLPT